jgi:hypothetical protein
MHEGDNPLFSNEFIKKNIVFFTVPFISIFSTKS